MQRILIKRLGPISQFEASIKKINLFIGEQASGKSTISKCIYFFRTIKSEIIEYLYQLATKGEYAEKNNLPKALNTPVKDIFVQLFGYSWDLDEGLYLKYNYTDSVFIEVKLNVGEKGKKYISVYFSKDLVTDLKNLEEWGLESYKSNSLLSANFHFANSERIRIHEQITKKVNEIFQDALETYYIPAGRSLLTLMTNQKTKLNYESMDLINRRFMQFIESLQSKFELGIRQVHRFYPTESRKIDVSKVSSDIVQSIKGDYRYSKGKEYFIVENGKKVEHGEGAENAKGVIPINFASSGQQEILWLFNQLYILMLKKEEAFVIIEEPEAHLYPTLQKEVMEFIVQFANVNNSNVVITTHSPYVLTVTNTLYQAGKLYEKGLHSEVDKIVGKNRSISPQALNAIKLDFNDNHQIEAEKLIDDVHEELKTELIDEISNDINEIYSKLYYLEVENESSK